MPPLTHEKKTVVIHAGIVAFFLFFFFAPVFWIISPDGCFYRNPPFHTQASLSYYLFTIGVVQTGGHFQWQAGIPFCI